MKSFRAHRLYDTNKGMTLVELVVVLAIFAVVAGLTIFEYGNFRSGASVQNIADDIALSIRKAQSFAIGVRNSNADFSAGYGIHFSVNRNSNGPFSGSMKSFVLFADIPSITDPSTGTLIPNKTYDYDATATTCDSLTVSASHECTEVITLTGAEAVTALYVYGTNDAIGATAPRQIDPFGTLDIVFLRPEADAFFCYRNNLSSSAFGPQCDMSSEPDKGGISHVSIELSNPDIPRVFDETGNPVRNSSTKIITIWNTGQISIN